MDSLPKHHFPLSLPAIIIIFLITFTLGIIIKLYLANYLPLLPQQEPTPKTSIRPK